MIRFSVRLGVHVSIAGGMEKAVYRARDLGCSTIQIFSRNPRGWQVSPLSSRVIASFREAVERVSIDPIIIHTPYLLNLASPNEGLFRRSISALSMDIKRAEQLGAKFVVTHLGSAREKGKELGLKRAAQALKSVMGRDFTVSLLLENSAGGGQAIGSIMSDFREIMDRTGWDERLGLCFDSCHGWAAGYTFSSAEKVETLAQEIGQTLGRKRLALLHLNDCRGDRGGHLDRHEHIGKGKIGISGFRNLLSHPFFRKLPMILETPKDRPTDDPKNLSCIRKLLQQ